MSLDGWNMYGDCGPIIGKWPQDKIRAPVILQAGQRIVLDNGIIREARFDECGARLPEGAYIVDGSLHVSPAWWWFHFHELLASSYPVERCCWDGEFEGPQCGDCPR